MNRRALGAVSKAWQRLRPANRRWLWGTLGIVGVSISAYLLRADQRASVAGTTMGLLYGNLAFVCMLVTLAYGVRKRWRPLVAQRMLGGRNRLRREQQRRDERMREARRAIAALQADIDQGTVQSAMAVRRQARRRLRATRAGRLLRLQLETDAMGRPHIWLVEKPPPGSMENWLLAHLYLGMFAVLFVAMHTGLRFGGTVAALGVILTGVVGLSGLIGAVLYLRLPRLLAQGGTPLLAPEMQTEIAAVESAMADFLSDKSGPLQAIFRAGQELSADDIPRITEEEKGHYQHLLALQARKRSLETDLARHHRLQSYLRGWLYIHIPAATCLLFTVLLHILSILYY